ncbi:MAG TPA: glycoside hydrolase family 3 C-terminal domain-containing protein [Acidimicrobiia bacterium]|nr:glycoside hydrolase family 3 C-terminal domain-containing protein [Acidimicrobiia bacterium]
MTRDIDALVAQLTLDEKAALMAGEDLWSTVAVERLGIPKVQVTDGPNGARGTTIPGAGDALPSFCAPCGSALGATWNVDLVEELGAVIGADARAKACRVLLAPTVNIHRSPLAGRNFECYSEDPLLSGKIAAAFVRGVQSQGVATTVKHFAGNDAEFERMTINSVIDERTLREITLLPFELAVREGGSLGIMTAYNRVNGTYCSEHAELIAGILRGEWGFDGFVLSDWYARGSTAGSPRAGLDLEMPGPGRIYGPALAAAVRDGTVDESAVDACVTRLLGAFERIGALDDTATAPAAVDLPEHRALARRAAAESMVLLQNNGGLLPFDAGALSTLAVIGPNAESARIMGGGSASLTPPYRVPPLDALQARAGNQVEIVYEPGCDIERTVPPVAAEFAVEVFAGRDFAGDAVHRSTRSDGRLLTFGRAGFPDGDFSLRASATLVPSRSGPHTMSLVQIEPTRVLLDGAVVLDGVTHRPPRGGELFGLGSVPIEATVELEAGRAYTLVAEYAAGESAVLHGLQLGCRTLPPPDLLDRAVDAARNADAAIVVVGTNDDWESEGHDREFMELPGDQPELIRRVAAANPRTVVVVNAASPVTTDWAAAVPTVLVVWFGGQEMAHALADVLFGDADPGGRLPTTFPVRLEHNPSYGNFPGENGQVRYGEGVLVGYRWYDARQLPTSFPFGHGLSYSTFAMGTPRLSATTITAGDALTVTVEVTNTGTRHGTEVVQCYVAPIGARATRPPKELQGFAKVALDPGETRSVTLELPDRAFAYWQPASDVPPAGPAAPFVPAGPPAPPAPGWRVDPGIYEVRVGRSSADLTQPVEVTVAAP